MAVRKALGLISDAEAAPIADMSASFRSQNNGVQPRTNLPDATNNA